MSNSNKTYRINTKVGVDNNDNINLNLNVLQKYDILEILSLKIGTESIYKTHTSGYGCVVGRVLANGGIGVPNAKISIFIEANENTNEDEVLYNLYPYKTTRDRNSEYIRYNLLPDEKVSDCHQIIGTFPNKRLVLDDKNVLEIFENYYKFTTVTNESGDYMLFGVPTGNQTIHMDLDLSDIGFLSQKPVDMKFKGYNNTMFENPKQFKTDTNIDNLVQVMSQSSPIYIKPFWGEENGEELGITRHDIDVNYKFEPTCVFMGSMVSDSKGNGFSKNCIPSRNMGRMEKLTAGHGTIEMIRKKPDGSVEEFPIMGNELIDENGIWCYQIPMNLDYITTDEYGNLVPTDNPEKGIPTRTRVRFRLSKSDYESDSGDNHLAKVLIPNNPQDPNKIDYVFGSYTKDDDEGGESFRDLFWNNVYTVKSHIPRIQKGNNQRTEKFSGIKNVNTSESNNPIPYNNMRVNITFMFVLQCAIIKALIFVVKTFNTIFYHMRAITKRANHRCLTVGDGLCPELEGWYFAPGCRDNAGFYVNTLDKLENDEGIDEKSTNKENSESDEYGICLTNATDYLMQCIEINLALEHNVIQFDFYNDWLNGVVYIPRWFANIRKKGSFLFGLIKIKSKVQACMEDTFSKSRRYVQQCAMGYNVNDVGNKMVVTSTNGCHKNNSKQKCHKRPGRKYASIFGKKGGIVHNEATLKGQKVYYLKPCEKLSNGKKCNLYATDIVLLGNINKCNIYGIPSEFDNMASSTYQLPPVLVQTNMDSDGILYGFGDGTSRCSKNQKNKKPKPLEQNFKAYEKWAMGEEPIEDITEYAISEISGIDWGLSGPNQGSNDPGSMYFPGGHFLGISCFKSAVNTKSCVNLSRICEVGMMMSQRQSKVSFKELPDGNYIPEFKYLIPSGFIAKDEMSDNNFRNIFATLNYNHLKTKKNLYGLREYDFISLQPINLNGEFKNKVNNKKYNVSKNDNPNNDTPTNAKAYIRTIEENNQDYVLFRFGIDGKNRKLKSRFLIKEDGRYYLPSYENSYYFYYGIKNGATALDKFLTDYFAECPTRGEIFLPEINVEITGKTICVEDGRAVFEVKNVPIPFNYTLKDSDNIPISGASEMDMNIFTVTGLTPGAYTIEVENTMVGLTLTKTFDVNETLPLTNEHNFYEDSCSMMGTNFDETPTIKYDESTLNFTITPKDNGGTIILNFPKPDTSKLAPYIYGFAITCDGYCVCHAFSEFSKPGNHTRVYETLCKEMAFKPIWLKKNTVKMVEDEENLYNISDNNINMLINDEHVTCAFKGWQSNVECNLYICYGCSKIMSDFKIKLVDSVTLDINNRKMSYYIYNENVTLSEMELNAPETIFEKVQNTDERIVKLNYNKLHLLTPREEWAIKRGLYFDESYYSGAYGKIQYGVVGGTIPYEERIVGTSEYLRSDGMLEMVEGVDNTKDGSIFPISTTEFTVPTKKWISGFTNEIGFVYEKEPYNITIKDKNNVVPYIGLKDNNLFTESDKNGVTPPNPWHENNNNKDASGIDLTGLIGQ